MITKINRFFCRYLMISNTINSQSITYKACFLTIGLCIFLSAIWAVFPLFGWSYYSPEGVKMSCGVEWQDHSLNVMSYNVTIFVFAFFLPLIILAITNWKIIKTVLIFFKFTMCWCYGLNKYRILIRFRIFFGNHFYSINLGHAFLLKSFV